MSAKAALEIYTDGGCLPNKRGAWAFIVLESGIVVQEQVGIENPTDSYRMEFTAALKALQYLDSISSAAGSSATQSVDSTVKTSAIVFTDSRILIDAATVEIKQWKANSWRRKSGRPILYPDLILPLEQLLQNHSVEWRWVKAHGPNIMNSRCDQLCRQTYGREKRPQV